MVHGGIDCDQLLISSPDNVVKLIPLCTTRILIDLTHLYAPEQIRHGTPITPATDIYTLGLIMYRMLTDRYPFEAETPKVLAKKHLYEAPVPPSQLPPLPQPTHGFTPVQLTPSIPPVLEAVILRCLEKVPEKRYKDGSQLASALTRVLDELG